MKNNNNNNSGGRGSDGGTSSFQRGNNNNNNQQGNTHYDKRKNNNQQQSQQHHHHQQQQHQPQQQQQHHQNQPQQQQFHNAQRERSGQRGTSQQYPDSSMNRGGDPSNLGSVKFTPGYPTRELPQIETRADPNKKFTGRCRLFVGNLPHNTSEDKLRTLFEKHGEVGEVYLGPKSAFAFVKMDTRQSAEAARDALDCSSYEGRTLRVRLAAHAAAIRVKHLSPQVTNELLAYAFRYFGEIERAVVVVDDKGKSTGEGIVEYSRKQSALYAIKRCQQECFILTASPMPVLVEPFDQQDEDEGLPEKSINKNSMEYKEQRDVGPRFAEQGTFEHTFALRWKELYEIEKQKRQRLDQEIEEARQNLQSQIDYSRLEHDTMQLRNKLQQLEDNKLKLQQLKEQTMSDAQLREEQRRQQDMLIQQREADILRRQQLGDPNGLNQQESALRMQANALQNLLNNQESVLTTVPVVDDQTLNQQASQASNETEQQSIPTIGQMTMMGPPQIQQQPRTFADVAMMGMQQPFMMQQQQMAMAQQQNPQMNQPNMFTAYMQPQMQMQMQPQEDTSSADYASYPVTRGRAAASQQQQQQQQQQQANQQASGPARREKFNRQYTSTGNNINVLQTGNNGGRPRKRGRF